MAQIVRQQISSHPLITINSVTNEPIERWVTFLGYASFDLEQDYVILKFRITLESPTGVVIATPTYLEYKLHTDIWFNSSAEVVPEGDPTAVVTEYDYWINQMINVAVPDGLLIQTGITNLDQNFNYFNQI